MCVGYELLLLPNKMPTKTPIREMSVNSAFSASRIYKILTEKFNDTLFIHQIFANDFAVR